MGMKVFQQTQRSGKLPSTNVLSTYCRFNFHSLTHTFFRVIDFGNPGFIPLWQLASTPERQKLLRDALATYLGSYDPGLGIKGPYVETKTLKVGPEVSGIFPDQREFLAVANGKYHIYFMCFNYLTVHLSS